MTAFSALALAFALAVHALAGLVKALLLLGVQRGVEGLDGFGTAVGLGVALAAQGLLRK